MFIELLGTLRCPNKHEDSPLVATVERTIDRHIIDGTLGCPICHAEYHVQNGAVDFGGEIRAPALPAGAPSDEMMIRLGALLGLDERGGLYVLDSSGSRFIAGLAELSPPAQFIALAADDEIAGAGIVIRGAGAVVPVAKGCARGIALDDATPEFLRSAVQALAPGGRLVAPANAIVPDGIAVLARDGEHWVGEREAVPALAALRRAPR